MFALKMIPHSRLKTDAIENIVKSLHNPIPYTHRYNFSWIDQLYEEGKSISPKKFMRKDVVKKLLEYKNPDTDLMVVQNNFSYEVHMDNNSVDFKFVTEDRKELDSAKKYYEKYIDRIKFNDMPELFTKIVEKENEQNISCAEMVTKEHFMFAIGSKENIMATEPLKYIMDLKRYLKDDERFIYQVILHPISNEWWDDLGEANKKFKEGKMPTKLDISPASALRFSADVTLKVAIGAAKIVEELVFGDSKGLDSLKLEEDSVAVLKRDKGLSKYTKDKSGEVGFEVSIRGICISKDTSRRDFLMQQFRNCFSCLDDDNKLIMRPLNIKSRYVIDRVNNREIFGRMIRSSRMILTPKEIAPLMLLPQAGLQRQYNVERYDYSCVRVSKEILEGYIQMCKIYGSKKTAYWSNIKDLLTLSKCVVGIKGSGKSKYTEVFVHDAYKGGDCVVYFDYIENNLNSHEVMKHIPKEDTIVLDLSKGFTFDYPELNIDDIPKDEDYIRNIKNMASEYAKLVCTFVETINIGDTQPLTSNMQNILMAAASLCFIAGCTDLYSIYKALTNHIFREELVGAVKSKEIYREDDYRYVQMESLDDVGTSGKTKGKSVGTNNKADRVLDRFNALIRDSRTEEMMMGINRNNINFVDVFEQNKVVFVLMPEDYFSDYELKDIVMVYFLTRMRLSALKRAKLIPDRDKRRVVHCILDEIHQLDNSLNMMTKFLNEDRKFRMGFYFTCQYLKQFRKLWDTIKGSGCHYMLLAGTEKENYEMLKEEIGDEFEVDELVRIPKYHTLNIIRGKDTPLTVFMGELPKCL